METSRLIADENLLIHTIKRQAGTLQKAILEGTMNSIESGATRVDITLETNGAAEAESGAVLTITDDGCGIVTDQELADHFERFGTPHDESEEKRWAEFRMGRAQLFCFGKNTWRTATFKMVVDIETPPALEYDIKRGLRKVKGTKIVIDLYKNPVGRSIEPLKAAIKEQIEFMEVPVYFNGEQINTPASKCKWTHEDNDAYYLFGKGANFTLYNLGAFVKVVPASQAGVTGVMVSKKRLRLSVSRQEIIRSGNDACPVYDRIEAVVKKNRIKKVRKAARRLDRDERICTLNDLLAGEIDYDDVKGLGLFETCNDRVMSLDAIKKIRSPWCFAERGDRAADRLIEGEQAVCLSNDTLEWLNYSGSERDFFDWLLNEAYVSSNRYGNGLMKQWKHLRQLYRDFDELREGYSGISNFIPQTKWTKPEKRVVRILQNYNRWKGRTICIGTSDTNAAWTDGLTYICLGREYLRRVSLTSADGAAKLIHTMFHELAHDEETSGTHHHGMEFYRAFHELTYGENAYWCPLAIIADFHIRMKQAKIDEQFEVATRKEARAKAARDNALGLGGLKIAAKRMPAKAKTPKLTASVIGPDGKRRRKKRY